MSSQEYHPYGRVMQPAPPPPPKATDITTSIPIPRKEQTPYEPEHKFDFPGEGGPEQKVASLQEATEKSYELLKGINSGVVSSTNDMSVQEMR